MPITKSAKKKQRSDKTKKKRNDALRNLLGRTLKTARKNPSLANISKAVKMLDKLAKRNIIHKNKADRIKSSLSKLVKVNKKPQK